MTTTAQNFTMWSGDDKTITVTVVDGDGTAQDITAATISYKLQPAVDDATGAITKTVGSGVTITNAAGGIFTVDIAAANTASFAGIYYHECQVTSSGGVVSTVFVGNVTINQDAIT